MPQPQSLPGDAAGEGEHALSCFALGNLDVKGVSREIGGGFHIRKIDWYNDASVHICKE